MSKIEELYNINKNTIMLCVADEEYTEKKINELIAYVNNYNGFLSVKELNSAIFVIIKLICSDFVFDNKFSFDKLFQKLEDYYGSSEYERVKTTTDYFLNKCQN